jgi:outer membrane protein
LTGAQLAAKPGAMTDGFARGFVGSLALIAAFLVGPSALAQAKVAVVDTQRAIMETEDGLRAQATLKKVFDNRQRELDKKQEDLQRERADIEKQQSVVSKAALAKRVEKWQRDMIQLQTVFVEYNKELQKKQNELTQPIFQKAMGIIRRMATQDGYDVVIDKQAVPYVRSDLDLTDRIITLYNQGAGVAPGEKPAPGAKPAGPAMKPPAMKQPAPLPPPAIKPPAVNP